MKFLQPPLAAIFFMTYFYRAREAKALSAPWIRYCFKANKFQDSYDSGSHETNECQIHFCISFVDCPVPNCFVL